MSQNSTRSKAAVAGVGEGTPGAGVADAAAGTDADAAADAGAPESLPPPSAAHAVRAKAPSTNAERTSGRRRADVVFMVIEPSNDSFVGADS